MKLLVYDIEADNLLLDATRIHCIVTIDPETNEVTRFRPHEIVKAYKHLQTADRLIAHNGVMYDGPVLERLVGEPNSLGRLPKCFDTLLVSRLLWPDKKGEHPAGGHSLKNWGAYLSNAKGEQPADWTTFTEEMLEYCEQDVCVTVDLYKYLLPKLGGLGEAVVLEHRVAEIIVQQIQNGFPVDMQKVRTLHQELSTKLAELNDKFSGIPPWVEETELKTPAYWEHEGAKYPTKSAAPAKLRSLLKRGPNKIKRTEILFNPNSGAHKARLFVEKYGWAPDKLGAPNKWFPAGVPTTDRDVMASLDYPEAKVFTEISKLEKLMGTYTGAWTKHERDGRVHGDVITNGTVSGRMAHNNPNMKVPKVKTDDNGNVLVGWQGGYGYECRDCFTHRKGWMLVGADASGLELRMLAHFLARWDGGKYADIVLHGDVHTANQEAAGLPTRDNAKTFIYGWLYGAGDQKIGQIVGKGRAEGKRLKTKFLKAMPAVDKLIRWVKPQKAIRGLDGRPLPVRSDHMALNTLLQSAGAVVMKKALVIFYEKMTATFGPHGERWGLCANVHDEQQWECEPEIADESGQLFVDSLGEAGEYYKLNIKIDGEYKKGSSWAKTH